mgnify:CR=1 FL=1|jgi:hypothetical protein
MTFNLDEVNERARKANELLEGVRKKTAEVKQRLRESEAKVAETPKEYWDENPLELLEFNKMVEDDLSLLGLLKEETEKRQKKAEEDLVQIMYELRKEWGDV